jgi:hypothetical protein
MNFKSLDRTRKAVVEDDTAFLFSLREIVDRVSREAVSRCR